MLTVSQARSRVLEAVSPLDKEEVLLAQALGRVLAEEVLTPHPLPRFDNSAMDGYALRAADTEEAPVTLKLEGESRAGMPGQGRVLPGRAMAIMTGAALPPGADAVVRVEDTEARSGEVKVLVPVAKGANLRRAGEDLPQGATAVPRGLVIGAGELAMLASTGNARIPVYRRPRVAVLVTGDELVGVEETPGPGQIRDSNSYALSALVAEAQAELTSLRRAPDDLEGTVEALEEASLKADLVISSGGVAVGRYDFVKQAVEKLGSIELWRVAMQPGRPVVLGSLGRVPFLGLPGNPVSIHIGFEQFVRPALRKMQGTSDLLRPRLAAELTQPLRKPPGRLHFVRVRLRRQGEVWLATPTGPQGSHIQSSLVDVHGVALFPEQETALEAGDRVEVEVWSLPGEEAE